METLIQFMVILAIFSIAVVNAVRKDKLKKLEEAGESLEYEEEVQLDEWFDEAPLESYDQEGDSKEKRPLKKVYTSIEERGVEFDEGVRSTCGKHLEVDEDKIEVEPIIDISSREEIRKGIIWSEILQRKYL